VDVLGRERPGDAVMDGFPEAERSRGAALLEAADASFLELSAPSRLSGALLSAATATLGIEDGSPLHEALSRTALLGYACRLGGPGCPLPRSMRTEIASRLAFSEDGRLDYPTITDVPSRLRSLLALIASLADDAAGVAALADVSDGAWAALSASAASRVREDLSHDGLPRAALPDVALLGRMLRLGYALRLVDEVAGESPVVRAGQ